MARIVLATLNAKFIHTAFGLRYLLANLGPLQDQTALAEFELTQRPLDIAEAILQHQPELVGLGVYVWNARPTRELVALLKRLSPSTRIVLGGPEVSYESAEQEIVQLADLTIAGEADLAFRPACEQLLTADQPPPQKVLAAPLPDLAQVRLPYTLYSDGDIAHRIVYVEASRGCPFTCEFCLSSLDIPVRQFPLPHVLSQLQQLLDRGLNQFKFVDRTFNLNLATSRAILEFFLERLRPGLFLHFEMIPDRFPPALLHLVRQFPAGTLQFEVGIQTFNPDVAARIQRRQNFERTRETLETLRAQTGVHVHADLIVGLPGESLESFASGFDQLVALRPHEIQVGVLKRLRGTPLSRHDEAWQMVYHPDPPYEILANRNLDFPTLQRLRRFARFWDLVANSGNFTATAPLVWLHQPSPFTAWLNLSDWLFARIGRHHAIALNRLAALLFDYLSGPRQLETATCARALLSDFHRTRRDPPPFLQPYRHLDPPPPPRSSPPHGGYRQQRHAAASTPATTTEPKPY